jgi:hypothetical protein
MDLLDFAGMQNDQSVVDHQIPTQIILDDLSRWSSLYRRLDFSSQSDVKLLEYLGAYYPIAGLPKLCNNVFRGLMFFPCIKVVRINQDMETLRSRNQFEFSKLSVYIYHSKPPEQGGRQMGALRREHAGHNARCRDK